MLQLLSMNCTASQSKSAESVGGFPFFPKLTTVGTSGQSGNSSAMVMVSRERLEQLRSQMDVLVAALNARGQ